MSLEGGLLFGPLCLDGDFNPGAVAGYQHNVEHCVIIFTCGKNMET